jgi:hypothetical protein
MSRSIIAKSHKVSWVCSALVVLAACSSDEPAAMNPSQTAGTGGADTSTPGTAGSGGGATGTAGSAPAAGGGGRSAAGNGGATAAAAGSGGGSGSPSANVGGASGGGAAGMPSQPPPATRPTECRGIKLPPRALGGNPPFMVGPEAAGLPGYWPTTEWKTEMPEKLGFDPAKLMAAADFKTQYSSTQAVFVVRHGYVALEKYTGGFTATTTHESYSMAKSFTSGLVGIAIGEAKVASTDVKICASYPMQWDCSAMGDPRSRITIDHAMNLETGLRWSEDWRSTATGTNDAYGANLLDTVLARESVEEPGMRKRYSTGDPALLSGVLQQATGMTAYAYGKAKVFDVIGATSIRWNADNRMRTTTYAGLQATARDYAKYGYLYLRHGEWDGKQVIPGEWIDRTTQGKNPCEDWNQYLWHINPPARLGAQDAACDSLFCLPTDYADLPPDGFFAEGVNVRLATDQAGSEHWDEFARGFLGAIMDAIK